MKIRRVIAPSKNRSEWFREWWPAFALVAFAFLAFGRTLTNGFIWDDPDYIVQNPTIRSIWGLWRIWTDPTSNPQYYPLVHTSFWIEFHLYRTHAFGYHFVNIAVHATSAVLIWRTLKRLNVPGALLAGAIFATHPLLTETVAWATERKNTLSLLFYLLALRAFLFHTNAGVNDEPPGWRGYAKTYGFFLAALLSKTVTATLPAALLVIVWWKRGSISKRTWLATLPMFFVGLTMSALTSHLEATQVGASAMMAPELNLSVAQRILVAGRIVCFYAGKVLWPHPLIFIYPRWSPDVHAAWRWMFPAFVVAVLASLWMLRQRVGRGPFAAAALFCGTLVPALGFVNVYPMRFSFVADHFSYHADVYAIAAAATGIAMLVRIILRSTGILPVSDFAKEHHAQDARVTKALNTLSFIAAFGLAIPSFNACAKYRDEETLWRATLLRNAGSWMVYTNLGSVVSDKQSPAAMDEAETLFKEALRVAPELPETNLNVGNMAAYHGNYATALTFVDRAIALNPRRSQSYLTRGQILGRQDKWGEAVDAYREAVRLGPQLTETHLALGKALEKVGDFGPALEQFRLAVALGPMRSDARIELGRRLLQARQFDNAVEQFAVATDLIPENADYWSARANAELATRKFRGAAESFKRALEINPTLLSARTGLATAEAAANARGE